MIIFYTFNTVFKLAASRGLSCLLYITKAQNSLKHCALNNVLLFLTLPNLYYYNSAAFLWHVGSHSFLTSSFPVGLDWNQNLLLQISGELHFLLKLFQFLPHFSLPDHTRHRSNLNLKISKKSFQPESDNYGGALHWGWSQTIPHHLKYFLHLFMSKSSSNLWFNIIGFW